MESKKEIIEELVNNSEIFVNVLKDIIKDLKERIRKRTIALMGLLTLNILLFVTLILVFFS